MKPYYEDTASGIVIYHGDCRDVLPTLGKTVATTVTSPPYNHMDAMNKPPSGTYADSNGGLGFVQRWQERGYLDSAPESEYQFNQMFIFNLVRNATIDGGSLFYNHQLRWRDSRFC